MITVKKYNEVYLKIVCDRGIAYELYDYFSFFIKNHIFHPQVKERLWDGRLHLFDLKTYTIYFGLLDKIISFCKDRQYKIQIDNRINISNSITLKEVEQLTETFNIPENYSIRDYQLNSLYHFLKFEKMLLISPTGCMDPNTEIDVYVSEEAIEYINTLRQGLKTYPVGENIENKNST